MPTFVLYKCKKCNQRLGGHDTYHSIGQPFLTCSKCKNINLISNSRTEWDLMTQHQKIIFAAKVVFFSLLIGSGFSLFLTLASDEWLRHKIPFWITVPIGLAAAVYMFGNNMRTAIEDSRKRMQEKDYRLLLAQLGLLNE